MVRTSAPFSGRCVAKLCRSVCTVTFLLRPPSGPNGSGVQYGGIKRPVDGRGTSSAAAGPAAK